jgi:hypothetical protein
LNFFENSSRYSQVKVQHGHQQHRRQILPPIQLVLLTGGKFVTGDKNTSGKFAAGVNDSGGKLPPVSMGTISGC